MHVLLVAALVLLPAEPEALRSWVGSQLERIAKDKATRELMFSSGLCAFENLQGRARQSPASDTSTRLISLLEQLDDKVRRRVKAEKLKPKPCADPLVFALASCVAESMVPELADGLGCQTPSVAFALTIAWGVIPELAPSP